jgi:hypothetical protein
MDARIWIDTLAGGDFDGWYQRAVRVVVQPVVVELVEEVRSVLGELKEAAFREEGLVRDRYRVFEEHLEKSPASVRRKVARDLEDELKDGAERMDSDRPSLGSLLPDEAALRARVLGLGDLGRFRVVGCLQRDVDRARERLVLLAGHGAQVKDFVRDEGLRRPLAGHRAVQFCVRRDGVGVEVQIMTELQHTWDRRNHAFYEWFREGGRHDASLELRIDDHAAAETLHVIDKIAESTFRQFLELRAREGSDP